jgi:hypothetical protein
MASTAARNRRGRVGGLGRHMVLLREGERRRFWLRGGDGAMWRWWFLNFVFGLLSVEKVSLRAGSDGVW